MPDYSAGTASVRIRPNADDFVRDLNAKLKRVRDPGFTVTVDADLDEAARQTERWRTREEREGIEVGVEADTSAAAADLARFRREEQASTIDIGVDVDTAGASAHLTTWRAAQQVPLQIRVDVDTSMLQKTMQGVGLPGGGGAAGRGGGLLAALIPAAGAGALASLPAIGSVVANLTQAVTQLSGAGLVLPGVIGGIASTAITAKVGFTGMADALEAVNEAADGTPESLQAAQDALGKLAPAAADAVKTVADLKPEWEAAVRDTFQQNMFVGLDDDIRASFDSVFPVLKSGLGDISTAWNGTFTELLGVAGSDNTKGILTRILGNTADGQRIANDAILPITNALGTLTATGAESLPRLAYDLQSVADRFDNWVGSAAADGRLDEWIGRGITGFEHLGNSVLNIGGMIGGIASATDGDLLASIERVTEEWDEWINSTEGQDALKQFIADGDALLSSLATSAKNLGPEMKAAFDLSATSVGTLVTSIESISTALKAVENTLPGFTESFKNHLAGPLGMINQLKSVLDNNPLASDLAQGDLAAALKAARENDPRTKPTLAPTDPAGGPAIATPPPAQGPGLRPNRTVTDPHNLQDLLIPTRARGGPTPSGRGEGPTGGFMAEVHADEWVLPAHARAAIGDKALWALTRGRSFSVGGTLDEHGNPITPGPLPGPVAAPSTMSIAPNPTAPGTGGLGSIFSQFVSGLAAGPMANAMALGQQLGSIAAPGAAGGGVDPNTTVHGTGAGLLPGLNVPTIPGLTQMGTPAGDIATRGAEIGGFAGLFSSLASPDPLGALTQWGGQTANWLANWGMETLGSVGSTLWQGALGFFGLENSILSPSNIYNQAAQQTGQFFLDQGGPFGQLLGAGQTAAGANGKAPEKMTQEELLAYLAAQSGTLPPGMKLPKGVGSEKGLQINTIKTKRAVSAMFPAIAEIGGVRKDALKWHPNGLAIDVMIPGGTVRGGANPEGEALGDQIFEFIKANATALGVDIGATLWKTDAGGDHFNHLHIATTGGGYPDKNTEFAMPGVPTMAKGGPTPNVMGPLDAKGGHLAVVHPKEFMISARGRASVPDSFLHALNSGAVDPKELPGYFPGGAIRPLAAAARPTPPRPPVVPARTMQPRTAPAAPAQPATPPSVAPSAPPAPVATPPPTPPQSIAAQGAAPAPSIIAANQGAGGINHNVDWMNTLIQSSASNIGQLVSTGMSIASMGAAGVPGAGAIGAAGPFAAGAIQQGGKVVEGIVNVMSSALVGSVPGSFGGKNGESPYGRPVRAEQDAPATAQPRGGPTYNLNGISDINRLMDRLELNDKMTEQATLASKY